MEIKGWVMTGAFIAALAVTSLGNLLTPAREYSEAENRYLQQMPAFSADELFSGRFTAGFDTYTGDQFWGRDGWVGLKTMTQLSLLQRDNGRVYFGRDGFLFEKGPLDTASQTEANCRAVAHFFDQVRELFPDVRPCVLLAPTAVTVEADRLPPFAPAADEGAVLRGMREAVGEALVDPTETLLRYREEGLYYRTDHHWTTAGAYRAYTVLAEALGLTPVPREHFQAETVTDRFFGTLYSKANLPFLSPDCMEIYTLPAAPCTVTWTGPAGEDAGFLPSLYDPSFLEQKDKYAFFLGGNHPLTRIHTGQENGKTLLILKDSYANALVPFLTAHYEHIVMVDLRYYRQSLEPLFTQGIDDLLVLYNVSGFSQEKTVAAMLPHAFEEHP
ncbi:MAG: hypothetical protein HFJ80_00090 [Clostridiales bacterium]|nr:hypothetical protein [Clostridiales bacterium]